MLIMCSHEYYLNKDLCLVTFKKYNKNKDDVYPSISLCIYNPYIIQNLKAYGDDMEIDKYVKFLEGRYWDERMLDIDYDNVTKPLIGNVIGIEAKLENHTWIWIKPENNKIGMSEPYITFKNSFKKCIAVDMPYLNGKQIAKIRMKISSKLFPNNRRPTKITDLKNPTNSFEGFSVFMHYPQQFTRAYYAGMGKWRWPSRAQKASKNYRMMFKLLNMEVFISRNKQRNNEPCDTDWRNYDARMWEKTIKEVGCRSPMWTLNKNIPLCTNNSEMKQVAPQLFGNEDRYPITCKRIEKLQFAYYEADIPKQNNTENDDWFKIGILYGDSIYKEIMQVRAYNYQSLIGKI